MKKFWGILGLAVLLCACARDSKETEAPHVLVMYMAGYNELSGAIATNIEFDLTKGYLPEKDSPRKIVIFSHCSPYLKEGPKYKTTQQYEIPTSPVLIQAYSENGKAVLDTLKLYSSDLDETDPMVMRKVLAEITERFPSDSYGLLYSSHGTGWLPSAKERRTRTIGAHYNGSASDRSETDIKDFAKALPVRFDYIIMDACFMGAVEVVYQLRNSCNRMLVSEVEVPSQGFDYKLLASRIFAGDKPDLEQICRDYIQRTRTGESQMGGTIALINTAGLEGLAKAVASSQFSSENAQELFTDSEFFHFYDLRSICGEKVDEALSKVVLYEEHTARFKSVLLLKQCCGLSIYAPSLAPDSVAQAYYRTLDFAKAIGYE